MYHWVNKVKPNVKVFGPLKFTQSLMQKNSHFASISKYHASADGDGIVFNIQRFRLLRGSARVYILTKKTNRKYLIVLVNIFDQRKNSQM